MMKTSSYLKIERKDDYFYVYHTLFGNLSVLDEYAMGLLLNYDSAVELSPEDKDLVSALEDNFFLVDEFDEERIIDQEVNNRKIANDGRLLTGLQLIVSNFCNFKCKYCFLNEEHKLRDNSEANAPSNMDEKTADAAIDFLIETIKKNGNKALTIEFFGGEPLVNWRVIKHVFDRYEDGKGHDIKIYYTITTNGSLISDEILDYFEKYDVSLIVSYDSPKSKERILSNQSDIHQVLYPVFERMKNRRITKSFNSVISRYTIKNYDYVGLVDLAINYSIDNIGLILDLDVELFGDNYSCQDIVELLYNTYEYGKSKGIGVTGYWEKMYAQINNHEEPFYIKGYKACPAVGCKISVEPSGDIFACKCCPTKIGEIDNPEGMTQGTPYREYVERIYTNCDACDMCELKAFCSGVCVGSLEKKGSKYGQDTNLCYIYKQITRKLIINTPIEDVSTTIIRKR